MKFHYNEDLFKKHTGLIACEQLPCAFFLTKRNIFKDIGLMNENYFLFFEDMDLSLRINKKYTLFTDTSGSVLHYGGSSFNIDKNPEIYGKYILSMNIFFDLNYSALRAFLLKIITLKNSLLILLVEYSKIIFRKNNNFRIKKHKYFLKLFKEHYF
jgi:GT2 family glycosyltransferase